MKHVIYTLSLLLMLPTLGLSQEDDFIFFYDFNGEKANEAPSDPWRPTAAGEVAVEDFPSSGNKSVRVTDKGSGGGMTLILDSMIEDGIISLEFRWFMEISSGSDVEIFYVLNQKCPDDWSGVCVAMLPGGKPTLEYHDGAWIHAGQIEPEVWHDFRLIMHLDRNEYDFYYDGEEIVKNAAFRNYAGNKGIDKFNVANVGNGGTTFVTYFDDIMLYEGTKKRLTVDPNLRLSTMWGRMKRDGTQ